MPGRARLLVIGVGFSVAGLAASGGAGASLAAPRDLQFVVTSDAHYGITRPRFRGQSGVDARVVNAALVAAINRLPATAFAEDGGLRAGETVGAIDFVAEDGDVANREEAGADGTIQSAAASWSQFAADYINGLTVTDAAGRRAPVFVVPGNHEVANAVGFYRPMTPPTDVSAMVAIYNLMVRPATPLTKATYEYRRDRVFTSRDIDGVHFVFVTVWPDSETRAWMEKDLRRVGASTPVVIFTHDQPDAQARHFINPNGRHDINARDRFENLLSDTLTDGTTTKVAPVAEQRALEAFFYRHPNITAYFHGNSNWNQFYDWTGPDHTVAVHTFRVDSPMKGRFSRKDETALSFQVATLDPASRTLTVRECLWNTVPSDPSAPLVWGASTTVALSPRPAPPGATSSSRAPRVRALSAQFRH